MKFLTNYNQFNYIQRINESNSITEIESIIEELNINKSIGSKIKDFAVNKLNQLKGFGKDVLNNIIGNDIDVDKLSNWFGRIGNRGSSKLDKSFNQKPSAINGYKNIDQNRFSEEDINRTIDATSSAIIFIFNNDPKFEMPDIKTIEDILDNREVLNRLNPSLFITDNYNELIRNLEELKALDDTRNYREIRHCIVFYSNSNFNVIRDLKIDFRKIMSFVNTHAFLVDKKSLSIKKLEKLHITDDIQKITIK